MNGTSNMSAGQTPQNTKVIWIAMLAMTLGMAVVVEGWRFWEPGFTGFVTDGLPMGLLRYVLMGVALLLAVTVFVMRKRLPPVSATAGPSMEGKEAREQAQKRFALEVITFSLIQDIAILGLVLFLLGGSRMDFYLFAAPAFIMLLSLRPGGGAREI